MWLLGGKVLEGCDLVWNWWFWYCLYNEVKEVVLFLLLLERIKFVKILFMWFLGVILNFFIMSWIKFCGEGFLGVGLVKFICFDLCFGFVGG